MRQLRTVLCPPSRSIYRRKLFLLLCRLTHHLSSSPFLPLSLSCDKCQSAGRCKWPKQGGQVSFIPAKTVFSPILLKKWPKRGQVSFMYSSKDCFPSDMYCSRVGRERRHHVVPFVSVGSKPMFRCTASEFKASAEFTLAPLN